MTITIACPSCRHPLTLTKDLVGVDVRCPACQSTFKVARKTPSQADTAVYNSRPGFPSINNKPLTSSRRTVDDEPRERPKRRKASSSNAALWWTIGGGTGAIAVLVGIIVVVLMNRGRTTPRQELQAAINLPPGVKKDATPGKTIPASDPVKVTPTASVPVVLTGEQIYQRLLKSTVFIESTTSVPVLVGKLPVRPPLPKGPAAAGMVGSAWDGTEDLAGYGKLRFEFTSPTAVTMIDAKEVSSGTWVQAGNAVTLTFGGVVYAGTLNNNGITGMASQADGRRWNWSVTRSGVGAGNPIRPQIGGAAPKVMERISKRAGTGALIDAAERLVVTNVHVVGPDDQCTVFFPAFEGGELLTSREKYNQPLAGRVVLREPRADLALVQLDHLPANVAPVPLAGKKAQPGQQVHSVGNPGASKAMWIYSPGKVRQVYKDRWQIPDREFGGLNTYDAVKLETDSPINPGDSGGPLVNDRGSLVAVAHGQNLAANNLSYFIEVSEVRDLVQRYFQLNNKRWHPPPE